jgi:indolepyruvate ferredoxin oxidoreductase beta subunit
MGFSVSIGEVFGASQRGESVMSHLRISAESHLSLQIPRGRAHMVVALEPTEAVRMLKDYGNLGKFHLTMSRNTDKKFSELNICSNIEKS